MIERQQHEVLFNFRPIDWRQFIKVDLDEFQTVWKYNKQYFSIKAHVYDRVILDKAYPHARRAFYNMIENHDRQQEMWIYGVELIYIKLLPINKWLTCEGNLLTAAIYTHIRGNPSSNRINLEHKSEHFLLDRAYGTYKTFIDPTIKEGTTFLFYDGYYGNCGLDNLKIADSRLSTKKVF